MDQNDIKLYVCEDGQWNLAERYGGAENDRAVGDAKLSLRASGVSGVKVVHSHVADGKLTHSTLYRVVKAGASVPPEPDPGAPQPKKVARKTSPVMHANPSVSKPASFAPPPPMSFGPPPAKKPAKRRRRKIPTGQRIAMAGASGGIAGIAGPLLLSSNIAADALIGGAGSYMVYLTALALFLATFGSVLYVTGQIGREPRVTPNPGDGAPGAVPNLETSMALEEVMKLAAISAEPFAIQPVDLSFGAEAEEKPAPPPGEVQQLKVRLLQFLQECLSSDATKKHLPKGQLDAKNRFGFHLFMLGAGQAAIAALPKSLKLRLSDVVEQVLSALGSDPEKARSFAESIAGYQKEAKNAAMIRAGYEAMGGFLKDNKLTGSALTRALQLWNTVDRGDDAGDNGSQDVVIMFTDMVSSVETTQQIGDDGMMKLVDQHNLIVGAVLKQMRGHQVKHTGDGVMAVFPRVLDGVSAAAEIQRQIAAFNSVTQGAILKVRIGLSAGNPIRKDDDYFGTVVQTAARVCPVAGQGEIAMPDAVTKMPGCDRFIYSDPIAVPLKGFSEPQLVRKLLWNNGAPAPVHAPVAAAAPAPAPAAPAPEPAAAEMASAG